MYILNQPNHAHPSDAHTLAAAVRPAGPEAQRAAIPSPASAFGFEPGADYKLATYDQSVDYFRQAGGEQRMRQARRSRKDEPGRPCTSRWCRRRATSRSSIDYREIARRLAHPEGLTETEARELAREGKAFVHIDGGLHATEVAGPQHTPLLRLRPGEPGRRARHQG